MAEYWSLSSSWIDMVGRAGLKNDLLPEVLMTDVGVVGEEDM